jgi:hypothetical protein
VNSNIVKSCIADLALSPGIMPVRFGKERTPESASGAAHSA